MKKTDLAQLLQKAKSILFNGLLFLTVSGFNSAAHAQTVIYSTDFGTVANVNPPGWTFTGAGMNISTNNSSSGYTGASGGACLGEGNSTTFTNTAGNAQATSPLGTSEAILLVNTSSYSNVTLSFGMRKSSSGYNSNATYTLEWSSDGTTYNAITYTEATAGSWGLASGAGLNLPGGAGNQSTLYIKWTFVRTGTASNFKIDDVTITDGSIIPPSTISFFSNDTTVVENVASANVFLKLTGTSAASCAVSVSVSALSNASGSDYSLGVSTVTFAANAPVNSTAPVVINLSNDALVESAEYIILRLSNPQSANIGTISQFVFYIGDDDKVIPSPSNAINLNLLSNFSNGVSGSNSAEIVAHDPATQRLYIANSIGGKLDIVNFVNPSSPTLLYSVPITTYGNINSIAVFNGTVAAAIENGTNPQDSGKVVFFNQDGVFMKQVKVGMMPDMITFNHAGTKVLTANEGEPNQAYTNDPDGSVAIINIAGGISALTQTNVSHVTFTAYNGQESSLRAQGIRIFGLNASASKDFEPEYVTVSPDDSKAWVTLQENNAVVEIDLATNAINSIHALGTKDHNLLNNGMDASNVTKAVNISNVPVKGMYLPDAIASYTVGGVSYIITANEGDSRAYSGFSEEQRISAVTLDATNYPLGSELKNNYMIGRLNISNKTSDADNDGDMDTLFSYGSRSFSIWNASTGVQVYDSKDDFEMITSTNSFSVLFNVSNSNNTKKDRSDDKGPEPEGVTIGTVGANTYAFIALERTGGVMVYDVTNPIAPVYVTYVNNRTTAGLGPDLGSEGIIFIPQSSSPNGQHLVVAANEVSSTLSIWGIAGCSTPLSSSLSVSGPTANICSANSPTLSVASGTNLAFQWSRNGIAIPGATLNSVTANISGSYSVAIFGGTNCSTGSLQRTFSVNTTPTLTVTGPTAVCIGAQLTLTVSGASTYVWNNNYSGGIVSFFPSSSAVYSVTGTSTNACTASLTKTVGVYQFPTITISGAPTSAICQNQPFVLTASGAATYTWNTSATGASINIIPQLSATYIVYGTDANGCLNSAIKQITVNPAPLVQISASSAQACAGQNVILTASGANTYSWSNSAITSSISVAPSTTTSYTASGTGANGCVNSGTYALTVFPLPVLNLASTSLTMCSGEFVTISASGAGNYTWSTGAQMAQITVSPLATTIYSVSGTDGHNCTGFGQLTQVVSECTAMNELKEAVKSFVLYPNPAKTEIKIMNGGLSSCNLEIYNSVGALVMTKSDYVSESIINISELSNGIYFVKISSQDKSSFLKLVIE